MYRYDTDTQTAIRKAYIKTINKSVGWHNNPFTHLSVEIKENFIRITQAFRVLSNEEHQFTFDEFDKYGELPSTELTVTLKDGSTELTVTLEFDSSNGNPLHDYLQIPQERTQQLDFIKMRLESDYGKHHGFCADDILKVVGSDHYNDNCHQLLFRPIQNTKCRYDHCQAVYSTIEADLESQFKRAVQIWAVIAVADMSPEDQLKALEFMPAHAAEVKKTAEDAHALMQEKKKKKESPEYTSQELKDLLKNKPAANSRARAAILQAEPTGTFFHGRKEFEPNLCRQMARICEAAYTTELYSEEDGIPDLLDYARLVDSDPTLNRSRQTPSKCSACRRQFMVKLAPKGWKGFDGNSKICQECLAKFQKEKEQKEARSTPGLMRSRSEERFEEDPEDGDWYRAHPKVGIKESSLFGGEWDRDLRHHHIFSTRDPVSNRMLFKQRLRLLGALREKELDGNVLILLLEGEDTESNGKRDCQASSATLLIACIDMDGKETSLRIVLSDCWYVVRSSCHFKGLLH